MRKRKFTFWLFYSLLILWIAFGGISFVLGKQEVACGAGVLIFIQFGIKNALKPCLDPFLVTPKKIYQPNHLKLYRISLIIAYILLACLTIYAFFKIE